MRSLAPNRLRSRIQPLAAMLLVGCLFDDRSGLAADPGIEADSIRFEQVTQESATVSWTTTRPATTQVVLLDIENQFARRFPEPKGPLTTRHSATITKLLPGKKHACIVVAGDADGNAWRYPAGDAKPNALTFETLPFEASGPTRFRIDLLGSAHVFAGSDLYLSVYPVPLAGERKTLDLTDVEFDPPLKSITPHLITERQNLDERQEYRINKETNKPTLLYGLSGSGTSAKIRLRVDAATPPGRYQVTLRFTSSGVTDVARHSIDVLPTPGAIERRPVTAVKPIPELKTWQELMLRGGKRFGKQGETLGFGYEGHIWYYDGVRVMLQMSDYLQDKPAWVPKSQSIALQYADRVPLGISGWKVFPHGLAMYYWRYRDERIKEGALALARRSDEGSPNPALQRETAYILNAKVKAAQLGAPEDFRTKVLADYLMSHVDIICRHGSFEQPFYDGLTLEALIGWYEYTAAQGRPDHRIPPVVKKMLDWLWDNAVDKTTGKMPYQVLTTDSYNYSGRLGAMFSDLNNLVTPAFAWYWNLTGDSTYLERGDFLFEHSFDDSRDGFWNGKQFSQNYKASFDYVHYRSSAKPVVSLSDPSNNPRDSSYKPDNTPPMISDIRVTRNGADVTITWNTDKPANAQVRYGASLKDGKDAKFAPPSPIDIETDKTHATTAHAVTITGLTPGSADYRFVVMSRDLLGNLAVSAEASLVTSR